MATRARVWRRRFSEEPGDSPENFSVLRGVTPVIQCDYSSLQSTYSSPDRVIARGPADGEADADGYRDALREVGGGQDIRVDARAQRGDSDAHSRASRPSPQQRRCAAQGTSGR